VPGFAKQISVRRRRRCPAAPLLAVAAACGFIFGCARTPHLLIAADGAVERRTLNAILESQPLGARENIRATALGRTASVSHHVVQIADREQAHVHQRHDLTVTLLRGTGDFHIGEHTLRMDEGDVAAVPRGMPHFFVNKTSSPAVAFVTFAPPYDGTDRVPLRP
jgi:mannose-6-phosphate isomerase-like protein (cupin superfamily)